VKRSGILVVLAVLMMAAAACTSASPTRSASSAPPPPRRGGEVVVGTYGEVDGFNPLKNQWSGPGYQIGRAVLDPLVVMDRDGRWQPYLAKSITPNADFTVWTFELRPGITFHDGEVLDAAALALYLEAATTSPLSAQGFPEKPIVATTGPMTVSMTFTQPWSAMPTALTEQAGYVIAPAQVRSGDTAHPIGTGPFVFDDWVPDSHFRATRNDHYWRTDAAGEQLPYLDAIEFRPIPDKESRINGLRTGDLDIASDETADGASLDQLVDSGLTVNQDVDNVGVAMLLMNLDRPPLDDIRVRQAIVSAIDREAFRDAVAGTSFELADQPYAEASTWHTAVDYPTLDPDRARELVAQVEAERGPIRISMLSGASARPAMQYLQQELAAVGIEVTLDEAELARFVQQFVGGDYDTVYLGGFFGATDPDGSYPFITSKGAAPETLIKLNFARYRNPVVDEALQEQRRTDDVTARRAAWATVWNAFATDLPYAFLYHDNVAWVTRSDVHGLEDPTTPEGIALPTINRWTPFYTNVYVAS
jgi:peptide/nickel transport system substrate-binding protein